MIVCVRDTINPPAHCMHDLPQTGLQVSQSMWHDCLHLLGQVAGALQVGYAVVFSQ